jgi:DNA-binding MarR family transcriptional regulator
MARFRYQLRRFLVFSENAAREAGIEPQQHQLLLSLKGLEDGERPTVGTLAERLQLRHHTTVGLVDRLAKKKLVKRQRSEHDGREILIAVTAAGEKLLEALAQTHQREMRSAGPTLVEALTALLESSRPAKRPLGATKRRARLG